MTITSTIDELIKIQAIANPHSIALTFTNQKLTYQELDEKSDLLAHHLNTLEIKPEALIGIYLERSLETVISILAVLKIGAAYVPLDPSYPQDRIEYMLSNANVAALITQTSLLTTLINANHIPMICLDKDLNKSPAQEKKLSTDALAYVLYTSGSTGKPKGVMINHSSLVNAYFAWKESYNLSENDIHLQMASFSFDVFAGDLIRALCSGSTLVLCPREILLNPNKLYQLIVEEKITCAEFVPAVLRKLMDYLSETKQTLEFMRLLICGSDNWSMGEYRNFKRYCGPQTRLINSYGLTEATIDSTYFESTLENEKTLLDEHSVPIGKPFKNTQVYLLDTNLNEVTHGQVGEIYISGLGLARGYLNLPQLTEQKFIHHSFANQSQIRLYQTGDLARYLPDGNIQFLGRSDNQIKFHGHRIELTEIENTINQHSAINQSLILIQTDTLHHKHLIAYLVFKHDITVAITDLKQFLKQYLPTHMIPTHFIVLESLPLTPNGKLDRQALATFKLPFQSDEISTASSITEVTTTILSKNFHIENMDQSSSFSQLGLSSLSLLSFVTELEKRYAIKISTTDIGTCSTLKTLIEIIEKSLTPQH